MGAVMRARSSAAELIEHVTAQLDRRLRETRSPLLADEATHSQFGEQVVRILIDTMTDMGLVEGEEHSDAALSGGVMGRTRALHEIHPRVSLEAAAELFAVALPVLIAAGEHPSAGGPRTDAATTARYLNEHVFATMTTASVGYVNVMLGRINKVQLEERRSLARQLHDNVAQSLASAALRLELSRQDGTDPDDRLRGEALALLQETLADVQSIAVELRQLVGDRGLATALTEFIETARLTERVFLHLGPSLGELSEQRREETFSIVREAIRNAEAHAAASRIDVSIDDDSVHSDGQHLVVTVRDDGIGFELAARRDHGMGLVGMRERAELIGAEFDIESAPGYGTTIALRVRANERTA